MRTFQKLPCGIDMPKTVGELARHIKTDNICLSVVTAMFEQSLRTDNEV